MDKAIRLENGVYYYQMSDETPQDLENRVIDAVGRDYPGTTLRFKYASELTTLVRALADAQTEMRELAGQSKQAAKAWREAKITYKTAKLELEAYKLKKRKRGGS